MFVVLAYDVQIKRVNKVMKIVKKYLSPTQKSVYEGFLSEGKLNLLKRELVAKIEPEKDCVLIYEFDGYGLPKKWVLGKNSHTDRTFL